MTTKIAGGAELDQVVTRADEIVAHIERQSKPKPDFMIGMEYERLGVFRETGAAIPYSPTIEAILNRVAEKHGWQRGFEGDHVVYLERGRETITLEPGGQTEYASAPAKTISELMTSAKKAIAEIDAAAAEMGVVYLGLGYQPFSSTSEIDWVPKGRYKVMAPYLARKGKLGHMMMKMTAGVQVSLDFTDGADAMRKLRAALLCTPIAQSLFAASGIARGAEIPFLTWRSRIWTETDDERCNIPAFMVSPNASLEEYVEWLLDMPLMFVQVDGRYEEARGRTLRKLLAKGARIFDVESAMTQAFPEARLKRFVEVRSLDGVQPYLLGTAPCFWTSLLYGDLDAIFSLLGGLDATAMDEMRHSAFVDGLKGSACGRPMVDWARDLLSVAKVTATCHENLAHLWNRLESRETPAERARELLAKSSISEFVARWNEY